MSAIIEPFFYCLFASLIWAPLVFIGAHRLASGDASTIGGVGSISGKVWPVALVIAALPVLAAPIAASLGLSLRAPTPLPPMGDIAGSALAATQLAEPIVHATTSSVSLADILRTAAVLYFYGFLMLLTLATMRHIWFAYRLNYAIDIDEPLLVAKLDHWRQRIGVTRQPRYVFSHIVSSVCVYGFLRPVIVMPYNLLDRISIDDAALMGAHEMAHVKRGDVTLFALCSVVKAVFWFNPFMHRICARANLAAEQGADALVLARGVNRRQYAHCFVQGLRLAANAPQNRFTGELVPSFTPFDKRSRRARLDAILSGERDASLLSLPAKLSLATGAILAAGLAFAQAALAVSPSSHTLPVAPIEGEIGLGYGAKSKLLGEERPSHEGVDIRAKRGTPVRAAGDGKVIDATERYNGSTDWGKVVVVDHGHGLVTRYAHLDSYIVHKGDKIEAGEVIGAVGSTGKATGPHLHFEVIENGTRIDPTPVLALAPPASPMPSALPKATPTVKTAHNVQIAPVAPTTATAPITPANVAVEQNETHVRKLDVRLAKLEGKLRERFKNFDAFNDLDEIMIRFDDFEFEGLDGAAAFSEMLDGREFNFNEGSDFQFITPDGVTFAFNNHLSNEEKDQLHRAREKAMKQAEKAMKRAKKDVARFTHEAEIARREILAELDEDDHQHAVEKAEREREKAVERMQRDIEREMERSQRQVEREVERAQREIERAQRDRERAERQHDKSEHMQNAAFSEESVLEHQERAIREARKDLDRQLAKIEARKREIQQRQRDESKR